MEKEEISPELARVHAHLCGDGSSCIWKTREKDRKFRAVVGYYNKNQKLLDRFRSDFSNLFGVKMKMRKSKEVCVKSIRIFNELKGRFGDFGSRKWRIPLEIKKANKEIKLQWMTAFFEDEAYHEKKYNRLKIKSVNYRGLKDIKEILNSLKIGCNLTGPNCDSSFYLTIPKFDSVHDFEGFVKEPARQGQGKL